MTLYIMFCNIRNVCYFLDFFSMKYTTGYSFTCRYTEMYVAFRWYTVNLCASMIKKYNFSPLDEQWNHMIGLNITWSRQCTTYSGASMVATVHYGGLQIFLTPWSMQVATHITFKYNLDVFKKTVTQITKSGQNDKLASENICFKSVTNWTELITFTTESLIMIHIL